jgi:tetratricopeptide (TPR) repeat protein
MIEKEGQSGHTPTPRRNPIWAYNPRAMDEELLLSTLVGRKDLIAETCRWLRAQHGSSPKRFPLFIGPRGVGKTTLLLSIYYTILRERDLARSFIPVMLPENVGFMTHEAAFVEAVSVDLESTAERLGVKATLDEIGRIRTVRGLADLARPLDRQIVLFVDNLHDLIRIGLDARGRPGKFTSSRAYLPRVLKNAQFLVIACSRDESPLASGPALASKLEAVLTRFDARPLRPLESLSLGIDLIAARARADGDSAIGVQLLREQFGALRGLISLTGGNPRVLVMLYRLFRRGPVEGAHEVALHLLDEISEAWDRELARQLPPGLLRVAFAMCKLGGRATASELAAQLAEDSTSHDMTLQRNVSTRLAELKKLGIVEATRRRPATYFFTPPLLQLALELKLFGKIDRAEQLEAFDPPRNHDIRGAERWGQPQALLSFEKQRSIRDVHHQTFLPLLVDGKFDEAIAVCALEKRETSTGFVGYLEAVKAVASGLRDGSSRARDALPPVERSVSEEILRQVNERQTLRRATQFAERGREDQAIKIAATILDDAPFHPEAIQRSTVWAKRSEDWATVRSLAHRRLDINESDPEALGDLGLAHRALGEVEPAKEALWKAVEGCRDSAEYPIALAELYRKLGDPDTAYTILEKAASFKLSKSDRAGISLHQALTLVDLARLDEAKLKLFQHDETLLDTPSLTLRFFTAALLGITTGEPTTAEEAIHRYISHSTKFGASATTAEDLRALVNRLAPMLPPAQVPLFENWATVAMGQMALSEFAALYGDDAQRQLAMRVAEDEETLALGRLLSDQVANLDDIRRSTTRENGVERALLTYASKFAELPAKKRRIAADIFFQGLTTPHTTIVSAATGAVGQAYWHLPLDDQETAIGLLLGNARNRNMDPSNRRDAVDVLIALYFGLENQRKKIVAEALGDLAKETLSDRLEPFVARISKSNPEETTS